MREVLLCKYGELILKGLNKSRFENQMLSDLAKKLKNGQEKARCIMCNYCGLVIEKEPTKCLYGKVK